MEVETQVLIAQNLGYLNEASAQELLAKAAELGRVLNCLLVPFQLFAATYLEPRGYAQPVAERANS